MDGQAEVAARNEDVSRLAELLAYRGKVLRYMRKQVRDGHLAEDLTQETMIRGLRYLGRLQNGCAIQPWLMRIAFHTAMDFHRKNPRESAHDPLPPEEYERESGPAEPVLDQISHGRREQRQWIHHLHRAMRFLSFRDRILIIAHYFVGLSCEQIARRSGLTLANVKVRLHRSRRRLRRHLPSVERFREWVDSRPGPTFDYKYAGSAAHRRIRSLRAVSRG